MTDTALTTTSYPRGDWELEIANDPNLPSRRSKIQYTSAARRFEAYRAGRPFTVTLVESYLSDLQRLGLSRSTQRQALAVIHWLADRTVKIAFETVPPQQAERIERDVIRLKAFRLKRAPKPLPAGRHIDPAEIRELLDACDDGTPAGARDKALISVIAGTASRNEEARTLTLEDLEHTPTGAVRITIRDGKGGKPRRIFLTGPLLENLNAWLSVRGKYGQNLFIRIRKEGTIEVSGEPLSYEGTRQILQNRFLRSGLSARMTWHDFRRTAIGLLFSAHVDTATQQTITGHADINTLHRYDRRGDELAESALTHLQALIAGHGSQTPSGQG